MQGEIFCFCWSLSQLVGYWGVPFSELLTRLLPFHEELVVHSTKWTTGSYLFLAFVPVSALSRVASGPLDGVDHWLMTFPGF